jgi:hypothetical protein
VAGSAFEGQALPVLRRRRGAPRERVDTGPTQEVRQLVQFRFGNRCARCGGFGATIQHRKPRGMGGSSDPAINYPSNLLWVCGDGTTGCHGYMESFRFEAYTMGWLVADGMDPAKVPVVLWDGRRVVLDVYGGHEPAPTEEVE